MKINICYKFSLTLSALLLVYFYLALPILPHAFSYFIDKTIEYFFLAELNYGCLLLYIVPVLDEPLIKILGRYKVFLVP